MLTPIKNNSTSLLDQIDLDALNEKYTSLTPADRIKELYNDFDKVLLTSSFGTTAVYLLHLFYNQDIREKIHFIDTTYHFEETLNYKTKLTGLLHLDVVDVKPEAWKNEMTAKSRIWESHPDLCCSINKVEPLEQVKKGQSLWVSGLMNWQTDHRKDLKIFEYKEASNLIKFYPILDVSEKDALAYIEQYQLPMHPLKPLGYESIGCKHCTVKGKSREGRWTGKMKTECGLHQ